MGVFIRTVIVCLVICIGYYTWLYLGKESYQGKLSTNETTVSKEINIKKDNAELDLEVEPQMKDMKICFMADENTTKCVIRKTHNPTLRSAISQLLKGPTDKEKAQGVYSEIPQNVKLMWIKDDDGKIIINLTRNFEYGGGTKSIQNRIKQLKQTVDNFNTHKSVYLFLDGKKVEYMGGEGIYIEQPLN